MSRRRPKAETADAHPTEFVGRNSKGAVRPADDRFLTEEQIAKRDEYLEEVVGPNAQQLVAKRERAKREAAEAEGD